VRFTVRSFGRAFEVPATAFDEPHVVEFTRYLEDTVKMEPREARRFVEAILAAGYAEIGESYGGVSGRVFSDVIRIRSELQAKYRALREHFAGRRGTVVVELPPELQPEAFRGLFNDLAERIEELNRETVEARVDAMEHTDLEGDIRAWDEERSRGAEEPVEPGSRGRRERPEPKGPGVVESERVELRYYIEALKGKEPAEIEATLDAARRRLFLFPDSPWRLPNGWKVRMDKSPEYGAKLAQQTALQDVDPLFAAHGYELHFETPDGFEFQPDAVQLLPDGSIKFFEYKDPLRVGSVETYRNSLDLQAKLLHTMLERAEAARSLPRCHGWTYDSSVVEMNEFLFDLLDESVDVDSPLRAFIDIAAPHGRGL
jgi:hypothetical protein